MEFELALVIADTAVVEAIGRHFNDVETAILRGSWQGQTYEQIADTSGYSVSYLTRDIGPKLWKLLSKALGEPVSKTSFRAALERHDLEHHDREAAPPEPAAGGASESEASDRVAQMAQGQPRDRTPAPAAIAPRTDWGEAPDVSVFFGREEELATLTQWIRRDRCRLVLLLGMGGIGKTSLAARLAQEMVGEVGGKEVRESGGSAITPSPHHPYPTGSRSASTSPLPRHPITPHPFTHLIWRSLRNAPQLDDLLRDLVAFLSDQQETEATLPRLMHWLRTQRCLIVLDNVETILLSGEDLDTPTRRGVGRYRPGYEDYGNFIRVLGETPHQSCLLLTSREKLTTVVPMEDEDGKVRSHQLTGSPTMAEALLASRELRGSDADRRQLCDRYSGNPLALKLVASTIQDLFGGDIAPFLAQETVVFNGIRRLLNQQFARLSGLEQTIMTWLAINREWTAIAELAADIVPAIPRGQLLEALESLGWRGLIERRAGSYTQQPVVMEYTTDDLIQQIASELTTTELDWCLRFALLKTTVKDYIRASQERMILQPIAALFNTTFSSSAAQEQQILRLVMTLRRQETRLSGYGLGNLLNLARLLPLALTSVDFSGLTIRQGHLQNLTLQHTNFAQAHFVQTSFTEAFGAICTVAFSPDGHQIAAADGSGEIRLWQVANGQPLLTIRGGTSWVLSVDFSPDGQALVSGSSDRAVNLWHLPSGTLMQTFEGHTSAVWCVRFNPAGTVLASGGQDCTVNLWQVSTGTLLHRLPGHTLQVQSADFSPDGEVLITSGLDQTIKFWQVATGQLLRVIELSHGAAFSIRFSPDGRHFATGHGDHSVCLWETETGTCLHRLRGHHQRVWSVRFSPDGKILASACANGTVLLWNWVTGQLLKSLYGHTSWVWSVAFSPDGRQIVSGSNDHCLKLWDVQSGQTLKTWQGYSNWVMSVRFSRDATQLISASSDYTLRLWDRASGKLLKTWCDHTNWVLSVDVHPDGTCFASGSSDRTIKLWSLQTHQLIHTFEGHHNSVWNVRFSPDGQQLASGSLDYTVKLWDVQTGKLIKSLDSHTNMTWAAKFSPDGTHLASCSHDCTAKLWALPSGQVLRSLPHAEPVWSVEFSPNGQHLATGCNDATVTLWNTETGALEYTLSGHGASVQTVCFHPEGALLATGSDDHTIKLWHLPTRTLHCTLTGHSNRVTSVTFSADGGLLASGSADETLKVWDVASGQCLRTYRASRPYEGMNITGATGLTDAQRVSLQALGAVDG
ncbi:MAG TPA: AAA family ATPase [Nodosilinea sp.]|nr:AAA family ATPase [Nodosilinea sp.]